MMRQVEAMARPLGIDEAPEGLERPLHAFRGLRPRLNAFGLSGLKTESTVIRGDMGFSLIELILAMGLFAVGMAMIAAMFPVAIVQSKQANQQTLAILIGENAEAIIKTKLKSSEMSGFPQNGPWAPLVFGSIAPPPFQIHTNDGMYPAGNSASPYGWTALARCGGSNQFEFCVIPYSYRPAVTPMDFNEDGTTDQRASPKKINATVEVKGKLCTLKVAKGDGKYLAVGSPVIFAAGRPAQYAVILGVEPPSATEATATISNGLGAAEGAPLTGDVWVVRSAVDGMSSAAIGCYVFRAYLP